MVSSSPPESYVFVSYSSADRARVFGVVGAIEAHGVPVWLDRRSIAGGRRWTAEIVRGIEDCAALMVMCSRASVASRNVQQEVQLAWESNRRLLPVVLEEVQLPAEIRYALAGQQWVEVRERPEEDWLPELISALRSLGIEAAGPPAPGRPSAEPGDGAAAGTAGGAVAGTAGGRETAAPGPGAPPAPRHHNLPAPKTTFVGRQECLAELKEALATHRLVTLTGPGGVGKSRLALELGWQSLGEYPDGVWIAPFDTVTDPELAAQPVATVLGISGLPGRPLEQVVAEALAAKRLLLILDNCDRVAAGCGELATRILEAGTGPRLLATTRAVLGTSGEEIISLPPLAVPRAGSESDLKDLEECEAVQLFVDRARSASRGFSLSADNARGVTEVCRALDGMPLAIELAAARVRVLAVDQIAERLADRFRLLRGADRALAPRQQTLQATVDWSYDALSEGERVLWRRLSVFAGGFTLAAAEAVCTAEPLAAFDTLDLLTGLVDKSLVMVERRGAGLRYRLLQTLRQYAEAKLHEAGEEDETRTRHADWCLGLVDRGLPRWYAGAADTELEEWYEERRAEFDNLRAALGHLLSAGDGDRALHLAAGTCGAWIDSCPLEGHRSLDLVLTRFPAGPTADRARVLQTLGWLKLTLFELEQAQALFGEALAISEQLGNTRLVLVSRNGLASVGREKGDMAEALESYRASLAQAREKGDRQTAASLLANIGSLLASGGDLVAGREAFREAIALMREVGLPSEVRQFEVALESQWALFVDGDLDGAERALEEWAGLVAGAGQPSANCLYVRGVIALRRGKLVEAADTTRGALRQAQERGDAFTAGSCLWSMAGVALGQNRPERAARLLGAADRYQTSPLARKLLDEFVGQARAALSGEAFEAHWKAGQGLSLAQAAAYALEEDRPASRAGFRP